MTESRAAKELQKDFREYLFRELKGDYSDADKLMGAIKSGKILFGLNDKQTRRYCKLKYYPKGFNLWPVKRFSEL